MRRGEIWNVDLPWTDGREQSGRRPNLIVHANDSLTTSPVVMVVPFSSRMEAQRFPACLVIEPNTDNGLVLPSVAMGFQLRAVDRIRFVTYLGKLSEADLEKIDDALRSLMDL